MQTKLIVRKNTEGNTSYGGFKYPQKGIVEAPDWKNNNECGNGLHGWDDNNNSYCDSDYKGNWVLINAFVKEGYVELGSKVKIKRGEVIYNGTNFAKVKEIVLRVYPDFIFHFDTQIGEDGAMQTAGNNSTQIAGDYARQTAMDWATQTALYRATQKARCGSIQIAGDWATQTAGYGSIQKARDNSLHNIGNECYVTTGINSVIMHRYYGKVLTLTVTEELANKKLFFKNGDYSIVDKA